MPDEPVEPTDSAEPTEAAEPSEPVESSAAVDARRPGADEQEAVEEGDEEAVIRYVDSPGAGLAGALDEMPEPNEPG